jgi:hypothetical protein
MDGSTFPFDSQAKRQLKTREIGGFSAAKNMEPIEIA